MPEYAEGGVVRPAPKGDSVPILLDYGYVITRDKIPQHWRDLLRLINANVSPRKTGP